MTRNEISLNVFTFAHHKEMAYSNSKLFSTYGVEEIHMDNAMRVTNMATVHRSNHRLKGLKLKG